eukprot:1142985-Amphidinium_carterae.1
MIRQKVRKLILGARCCRNRSVSATRQARLGRRLHHTPCEVKQTNNCKKPFIYPTEGTTITPKTGTSKTLRNTHTRLNVSHSLAQRGSHPEETDSY